jgi:hypothetical protein
LVIAEDKGDISGIFALTSNYILIIQEFYWFSDVWQDIKGTSQQFLDKKTRERSGAFPFELAYRLICMYSIKGDWVLDPFAGTGTTMIAALTSARNGISVEIDSQFNREAEKLLEKSPEFATAYTRRGFFDSGSFPMLQDFLDGSLDPMKTLLSPPEVGPCVFSIQPDR